MEPRQKRAFLGIWWWLVAAILCYLAVGVTGQATRYREGEEAVRERIQKRILEREKKVADAVAKVAVDYDTIRPNYQVKDSGDEEEAGDRFLLFVFRNDSLVSWNDCKTVFPEQFSNEHPEKTFSVRLAGGWYFFTSVRSGHFRFMGGFAVSHEFPFRNEYLVSRSAAFLGTPEVTITEPRGNNVVCATDGTILFGVTAVDSPGDGLSSLIVAMALFTAGSLSLMIFFYLLVRRITRRQGMAWAVMALVAVAIRLIQMQFLIPSELYGASLFGPALYSSSAALPSPGDLLLNVLFLLALAFVFYFHVQPPRSERMNRIAGMLAPTAVVALFSGSAMLLSDLVYNSPVSFNLQNISALSAASAIGLLVVTALFAALWLFSTRLTGYGVAGRIRETVISGGVVTVLFIAAGILSGQPGLSAGAGFGMAFVLISAWFRSRSKALTSIQAVIAWLSLFAVFGTITLNLAYREKQDEQVALLAARLATRRNPVTEVLYEQTQRKILADTLLQRLPTSDSGHRVAEDEQLATLLRDRYFTGYWKKYQVQVTLCDPKKELTVQPQGYLVNCGDYFDGVIRAYGQPTDLENLYFLDYGVGREFYLAVIGNRDAKNTGSHLIFIELSLKNALPDPGYPALLTDRPGTGLPDLSDYSYGLYQHGKLVRSVGATPLGLELATVIPPGLRGDFRTVDDIKYYRYRISDTETLVLSRPGKGLFQAAAPFPYLFLLFSLIVLCIAAAGNFRGVVRLFSSSLRNRLQFALTGILLAALVLAGIVQAINIIQINDRKTEGTLREKGYSIVVEAQHKFGAGAEALHDRNALGDFLVKLSNVFFTDINIYGVNGRLMASSRPQVFSEGLLSDRMDPAAFRALAGERQSLFLHRESIGSMRFLSVYLPFFDDRDQLLGYVNLPYFARQDEFRKEVSGSLVTFVNLYILLLFLGMFVIFLISNYITAPLAMIAGKMSRVKLGGGNERIPWRQNDEIGELVAEYNRMIGELAHSAEILARSEREAAWRTMAKQVAHEIKNPLTPMKLSAQYLEKAWKEGAPDWDQRLERFTRGLVEQIDALSVIASDFSDFARMPEVVLSPVNLGEVARYVLSVYQDTTPVRFTIEGRPEESLILADRTQLIRLLTNLINNALQAISDPAGGTVELVIGRNEGLVVLTVTDNGCGIPPDRLESIFLPDFTTRAGGMGLGLAIVRGIVETMHGVISVTSEEQKGTTFTLKFPAYDAQA